MQIKKIKINQYGNIEDKELNLSKFNVVYGKNEAGKSTILNFIMSTFYGISKNKNGKSESDFDRFSPWNNKEFSGNMEYSLDDESEYSVFRNFDKKNPQILDKMGIDVSKNFSVDKKNGIQFLYDQIGVDRETLESTVISEQKQVELDAGVQNQLLQKIANLAESGNEEISFKQANLKLDKMLLTEVGTEKSQERPINIAREKINELTEKIASIKVLESEKTQIDSRKNNVISRIREEEENKIVYEKVKNILERNNKEQEKIDIKKNLIKENETKIKTKQENIDNLKKQNNYLPIIVAMIIVLILGIAVTVAFKSSLLMIGTFVIEMILSGLIVSKKKKNSDAYLKEQIRVLIDSNEELNTQVENMSKDLNEANIRDREELIREYGNNISELFNNGIYEIIENNVEELNNLKVEAHKIEIDGKNIESQFENLPRYEEELEIENNTLEMLKKKTELFKKTKEILEKSYQDMKNSVTPKFNQEFSKNIEMFSNGKYKEISINDGLFITLGNGEKKPIDKLSTGTIEQIYLALRLSVINEISNEKLPIILDEAFAYYDNDRMEETLKYLYSLDNQVIILSCSDREKTILNKNGVEYNYVEL